MKKDHTTVSESKANLFREKIQGIVADHAQKSIDLCWALYEADHMLVRIGDTLTPVWEAWGYKDWGDFVGKEMGLHPTTAYAYKRIWETFYVDLAGAWDANNLQSITKMRILCAAKLTKKNVNAWLKKAGKMTCAKLVAEVYGTEELHNFAATVTTSELRAINKAILDGRQVFGDKLPRGEVLVHILKEWSTMHRNVQSPKLKAIAGGKR